MARDVQSKTGRYQRSKLLLSVITALAGVVTSFLAFKAPWHKVASADSAAVAMHVVNGENNSPVGTASVRLETGDKTWSAITDDMGNVVFIVPSAKYGENGRVTVVAVGFHGIDEEYFVLAKDKALELVLVPNKPVEIGRQSSYTQVFRSGARASGAGADYSAWYEVAAAPPKPGFVIDPKQSSFQLIGDRTCFSGWSECVLSENTNSSLVYRFRMQGHNERHSNDGIAYSEGILRVTYVPRTP